VNKEMPTIVYNGARIKSKSMIGIAKIIHNIMYEENKTLYDNIIKTQGIDEIYKNLVGRYPSQKQLKSVGKE